MMTLLWTIP